MADSDSKQLSIIDFIESNQSQELVEEACDLSEKIEREIYNFDIDPLRSKYSVRRIQSQLDTYDQVLRRTTRQKRTLMIENQHLRKLALSKSSQVSAPQVQLVSDHSQDEEFLKLKSENKMLREGLESSQNAAQQKQNAYRDLSVEFETLRGKCEYLTQELNQKEKDYQHQIKDLQNMIEDNQHDLTARVQQSAHGKEELETHLKQQKSYLNKFSEDILDLIKNLNQLEPPVVDNETQISLEEHLPQEQQEIIHALSIEINENIQYISKLKQVIEKITSKVWSGLKDWNDDLKEDME